MRRWRCNTFIPALRPLAYRHLQWQAAAELQRLAQGDIVVVVGGGRDQQGTAIPFGFALQGLEPSSGVASDWLTTTLREFARAYVEQAVHTAERAERAFARLLTALVFRGPGWKEVETTTRRRTDHTPASVVYRGSFPSTAKRFPERRVRVRLFREGDIAPPPRDDADFTLDLLLDRHLDVDDRARRALPGHLAFVAPDHARLDLNLSHHPEEQFYPDLQASLQPVVSPYQVTPLLLLALDEYLEEKRRAALIPKEVDREISQVFQPSLLGHAVEELFNAELGAPVDARGERVLETLVRRICEERFPDYRTVMLQQGWTNALRDYQTALERLDNRYERCGDADVAGTKEEQARRFNRANVSFDSFVQTYPDLIAVATAFKGREPGTVRFRLHPFEERVRDLLRVSQQTATMTRGGQTLTVHLANLKLISHAGRKLGYRDEEIAALLELMAQRELVEVDPQLGVIREVAHPALRREDLAREVTRMARRLTSLLQTYPEEHALTPCSSTCAACSSSFSTTRARWTSAASSPGAATSAISSAI